MSGVGIVILSPPHAQFDGPVHNQTPSQAEHGPQGVFIFGDATLQVCLELPGTGRIPEGKGSRLLLINSPSTERVSL